MLRLLSGQGANDFQPRWLKDLQPLPEFQNLEPWFLLDGEQLERLNSGLKGRSPIADLVPFACRSDRDDVACRERKTG